MPYFMNADRPLNIGHRDSNKPTPEHTLASYAEAYYSGVDYIDLDLHITKDGRFVTNNGPTLSETSDSDMYDFIFGDRKRKRIQVGHKVYSNKYLINDFTLEELQMLNRMPEDIDTLDPAVEQIKFTTLEEVVELILSFREAPRDTNAATPVGIYPKLTCSYFYWDRGYDLSQMLYDTLKSFNIHTIEGTK